MRLILVRHGQTPSNVAHVLDTRTPGPGLTALGEEQARAVVDALEGERVDALWASSAARAQLTATPLAHARGLAVQVHDGLRELEAGELEGSAGPDHVRAYLETAFAWARGDLDAHLPGAQDGHAALGRLDAAVAAVAASVAGRDGDALDAVDGGTAVAVSHGGSIRAWVAARSQVSADWAASHPLLNTGVVVLEGAAGAGWTALTWAGEPLEGPASPLWQAGPAAEPVVPAAFGG